METKRLHEIFSPFFIKVGRADITHGYYKQDYEVLDAFLEAANLDPVEFAKGAFYRPWGEQYYKPYYSPRTLSKFFFYNKWEAWQALRNHGALNPIRMERVLIRKTAKLLDEYIPIPSEENIVHPFIPYIKEQGLNLTYLCVQNYFWDAVNSLDEDLKDTYFRMDQLYYLRKMVYSNRDLHNYIKELNSE